MFLELLGIGLGLIGVLYLLMKIYWPWITADLSYIKHGLSLGKKIYGLQRQVLFLIDAFEQTVKKYPKKAMLIFQDESYSFEFINKKANCVANSAIKLGLRQGDTVAILFFNQPEFVWTYLGLRKIGVQVAFINFNLRLKSLAHSINVSQATVLIIGEDEELQCAVLGVIDDIEPVTVYTCHTKYPYLYEKFHSFTEVMDSVSDETPDRTLRSELTYKSNSVLIYTSGTTGLPKPAIITELKSIAFACFFEMFASAEDIVYEPLPLYHTAGSCLGVGYSIVAGATVVLRSKFSASHFWDDCRKYNVTIIHYVGEMVRYLVARPKSEKDQVHSVRLAIGNGLRHDVWKDFEDRFKIPKIYEFYGATELPVGFINTTNKFGSVGRSSPLLRKIIPCAFLRFDIQTQEPVRDSSGKCVPCKSDEPGLFVAKVTEMQEFVGYKGYTKENERKIIRDVFVKGDEYVSSGDLLYFDKDYNLYFSDRVGDTFRWKGENVSTTEVSNTLSELEFIYDAIVYGVKVPGCEGRAGMASLCLKEPGCVSLNETQLDNISEHVNKCLPAYARPLFLRVQDEFDLTGTFKQKKVKLVEDGFDVTKVKEQIYYLSKTSSHYLALSEPHYSKIMNEEITL